VGDLGCPTEHGGGRANIISIWRLASLIRQLSSGGAGSAKLGAETQGGKVAQELLAQAVDEAVSFDAEVLGDA